MNQTKKRNIIIGSLLEVLLLMVVGYAVFNSVLNITGTSGISSNWKILITNIETKNELVMLKSQHHLLEQYIDGWQMV